MNPQSPPVLHATPINDLRPTQITLGMYEVGKKRRAWMESDPSKLRDFLAHHMVPVVIGPKKALYLIDHHHLARALLEEGVKSVFVSYIDDLSRVDASLFWNVMSFRGWTHPYDAKGRRRPYSELPETIAEMEDDPYRSLSGELRNVGGYAKDAQPFAEFLWADFLRDRIKARAIERDFDKALAEARTLAALAEASYLPGWCGKHADDGPSIEADKRRRKSRERAQAGD